MKTNKISHKAILFFVLLLMSACNSSIQQSPIIGYHENYFSNRALYSYIAENNTHIFYANPYDNRKLYAFDKQSRENSIMIMYLENCGDIIATDDIVYLSGWNIDRSSKDVRNIYRIDLKNNNNVELIVESAISPLVLENKMYYLNDDAPRNIYEYDFTTRESNALVTGYDCDNMVILDDILYSVSLGKGCIIKHNLKTDETQEIYVEGEPDRLFEFKGALYFYTTGEKGYIYKMSSLTNDVERIVEYNNGDFYFTGLIATDKFIYFSGTELINRRTTGNALYRYDFRNQKVEKINSDRFSNIFRLNDTLYLFGLDGTSLDGPMIKIINADGVELLASEDRKIAGLSSSEN